MSRFEQQAKDIQLSSALAILDVLGLLDRRSLSFPDPRPYEDGRGEAIVFQGQAEDGREIRCAISYEALEDHFGAGRSMLKAFSGHQAAIEGLARRKYAGGQFKADGSILVASDDIG